MIEVTLAEAIDAVLRTNTEATDFDNGGSEFLRGQANLLAELFPIEGRTASDRTDDMILAIFAARAELVAE